MKPLAASIASLALLLGSATAANAETVSAAAALENRNYEATALEIRTKLEAAYNQLSTTEDTDLELYNALYEPIWELAASVGFELTRKPIAAVDGFTLTPAESKEPGHALITQLTSRAAIYCVASTDVLNPDLLSQDQWDASMELPREFLLLTGSCDPHVKWLTDFIANYEANSPGVGKCYYAPLSGLTGISNPYPPVECTQPHTLETYHVAEWTYGNPYGMKPENYWEAVFDECAGGDPYNYKGGKPEEYLGIPKTTNPVTRVTWLYFFPTEQQWQDGERWLRCDVALLQGRGLQEVRGTMKGHLQGQGPKGWAWCTKSVPTKLSLLLPSKCSLTPSPWVRIGSAALPGARHPGKEKAKRLSQVACKPLALRYGLGRQVEYIYWWSTPEQWRSMGAGFADCYIELSKTRWR